MKIGDGINRSNEYDELSAGGVLPREREIIAKCIYSKGPGSGIHWIVGHTGWNGGWMGRGQAAGRLLGSVKPNTIYGPIEF